MQKIIFKIMALAVFSLAFRLGANAQDEARLMRFPDINTNLIAFVYAGDIWTVDSNGGEARRLTSHAGQELFPKISPDGQWIAFSGEYSGNRQIFVMPSNGGTPRQLTWYNSVGVMPPRGGFDDVPLDWTSDSKNILFRANRTPFGERNGKYFVVSTDGGLEKELPIVNGGFAALSPDNKKLCFTPVDREFRTWKRYKGGRASDLWIYDLDKNTSEQITDFIGTDQLPTWFGENIYFASDRDLKLNIYQYNTNTKALKQMTSHADFDCMWPSGENGQMVYENGGFLYKLNLQTGKEEKVNVSIHFDNPNIVPFYKNVKDFVQAYEISPTGKRALISARGDIFSIPAENGPTYNLTNTQGVREVYPRWSPDGKYISYYSDASGEYEIYLLENKKGVAPKQLTSGSSAWKYDSEWSPNSKYLLYFDRSLQLKLVDVETGKTTVVTHANRNEIQSYSFSPDSRWVTYDKEGANGLGAVWVYNLETAENKQLTDDRFNDGSPVFSTDGKYIWFVSDRDYNLDFSSFEFNYVYNKSTRIYAVALKADSPKLFTDKNDTEPVKETEKPKEEPKTDKKAKTEEKPVAKEPVKVQIDLDGINSRITAFPMVAGSYRNLVAIEGGILYIGEGSLRKFTIEDKKDEEVMEKVGQAVVSADGKMMIYRSGKDFGITKLAAGQKPGAGKLNLDDMVMKIDPKKEWAQIYTDGWRIFRDYFYVSNIHGVDWKGIKERYTSLVQFVSHRADLDYILGEIVSETNTGHTYVDWGDFERVKRVDTGLLGAELKADQTSGKYQIAKIYSGENWNEARRSPLTEQGVNVKEGDYLVAINGIDLTLSMNPYQLLENTVGKMVEITVNAKPESAGAKTYTIKPIASELELLNLNWVNERRAMVDKLSGGKIGYIYVPNTSTDGNRELFRGMYAYNEKEALIIDDRYNGGGFIPDVMTGLLERKTLSYWQRNGLSAMKTPGVAHNGPKVMLTNGYSSSGGDAFPYYFRKKGLGKLIGTRTWGGLVGMSGNAGLVDGGYIAVPRFGIYDENEQWIIEGTGVSPDIEVVDRPEQLAKGIDPCIEKAVEVLLKELMEYPVKKVNAPAPPDRSKWHEQMK
ncbi:MAG: PDZ domain-containing protein [Bacteroidota bacterium]|nr:acetyl-CoA synthetase [Odoribacter sp.]MDP3644045.1 PDZ domain-containing protein [Bacteroidota bacterium]